MQLVTVQVVAGIIVEDRFNTGVRILREQLFFFSQERVMSCFKVV